MEKIKKIGNDYPVAISISLAITVLTFVSSSSYYMGRLSVKIQNIENVNQLQGELINHQSEMLFDHEKRITGMEHYINLSEK